MSDQQFAPQTEKPPAAPPTSAALAYPYAPQPGDPEFTSSVAAAPRPIAIDRWFPLLAVAALGLFADFAILPLGEVFNSREWGGIAIFACLAIMLAQAGMVSAWLVWSCEPFWWRLVCHWGAVSVGVVVWTMGVFVSGWFSFDNFDSDMFYFQFTLPAVGLAIQFPLWITRQYLGWRLVSIDSPASTAAHEPMSIRDILLGTLLVAASLGLLRLVAVDVDEIWIVMAVVVPVVMLTSTLSLLPIGRFFLSRLDWRLGLAFTAGEVVLACGVAMSLIMFLDSGATAWDLFAVAILFSTFVATLSAAALAARFAGYRLQTNRSAP